MDPTKQHPSDEQANKKRAVGAEKPEALVLNKLSNATVARILKTPQIWEGEWSKAYDEARDKKRAEEEERKKLSDTRDRSEWGTHDIEEWDGCTVIKEKKVTYLRTVHDGKEEIWIDFFYANNATVETCGYCFEGVLDCGCEVVRLEAWGKYPKRSAKHVAPRCQGCGYRCIKLDHPRKYWSYDYTMYGKCFCAEPDLFP